MSLVDHQRTPYMQYQVRVTLTWKYFAEIKQGNSKGDRGFFFSFLLLLIFTRWSSSDNDDFWFKQKTDTKKLRQNLWNFPVNFYRLSSQLVKNIFSILCGKLALQQWKGYDSLSVEDHSETSIVRIEGQNLWPS